jgi:hypothetical protein
MDSPHVIPPDLPLIKGGEEYLPLIKEKKTQPPFLKGDYDA